MCFDQTRDAEIKFSPNEPIGPLDVESCKIEGGKSLKFSAHMCCYRCTGATMEIDNYNVITIDETTDESALDIQKLEAAAHIIPDGSYPECLVT